MKRVALLLMGLVAGGSMLADAKLVTRTHEYTMDGVVLNGYSVYEDDLKGPRPGVLVVHQWMGPTENERMRAEMLARMGYVAYVVDVYGRLARPKYAAEAATEAAKYYRNRELFRRRVAAGLARLVQSPLVDPRRVAVIGYCFGGSGVLELARSGADLAGVVSFHGLLDTPNPADAKNIRAKVLVCTGAADPYVKPEAVRAFIDEMEAAGVDYQLIVYGGAVHAFTQQTAGDDPSKGAAYNADADRRSWQAMQDFFAEIFK
jgi:dienelactone hydrolase